MVCQSWRGAMELEHIVEVSSAETGGGFVVDLVKLNDRRAFGISEDAAVLHENLDDFERHEPRERLMIAL